MQQSTNKDAGAEQWRLNDDVIRLREWATDRSQVLPTAAGGELVVGSGEAAWLRLEDQQGRVSRKHATLSRESGAWIVRDAGSTNGIMADRVRCKENALEPGMELWFGGVTLVAESGRSIELRAFLARLLGWGADRAKEIDLALRAIRLAAKRLAALVLCGEDELVLLALALHRRVLGADRPFISADPRRKQADQNVRAVQNYQTGMEALRAAKHGSVCIWHERLPPDFAEMKAALRHPDTRVQLVVCTTDPVDAEAFGAVPIVIPAIDKRTSDLPRIVEEYAHDVTAELKLPRGSFPRADQAWVVEHACGSFPEVEKAILRILRLREVGGEMGPAAALLGMDRWSLSKWVTSRQPPVPVDKKRK